MQGRFLINVEDDGVWPICDFGYFEIFSSCLLGENHHQIRFQITEERRPANPTNMKNAKINATLATQSVLG